MCMCICVCVHVHVCVYVYVHVYVCMCMLMCMCVYMCMYVYVYVHVYVCMYVHVHVYVYVYVCVCACVYVCACLVCVCVCVLCYVVDVVDVNFSSNQSHLVLTTGEAHSWRGGFLGEHNRGRFAFFDAAVVGAAVVGRAFSTVVGVAVDAVVGVVGGRFCGRFLPGVSASAAGCSRQPIAVDNHLPSTFGGPRGVVCMCVCMCLCNSFAIGTMFALTFQGGSLRTGGGPGGCCGPATGSM